MMADFRALCAELTAWAEKTSAHYFQPPDVLLRARAALADGPAVTESREPAAVTGQPSDGEVAELVAWLRVSAAGNDRIGATTAAAQLNRAAELLEQQAPVAVGERP